MRLFQQVKLKPNGNQTPIYADAFFIEGEDTKSPFASYYKEHEARFVIGAVVDIPNRNAAPIEYYEKLARVRLSELLFAEVLQVLEQFNKECYDTMRKGAMPSCKPLIDLQIKIREGEM